MADMTRTTMTAAEFLELPESNQIVQLIHGEVIMSPAPTDLHQILVLAAAMYLKAVPGGEVRLAPLDVYIDGANVVQPDIFWVSESNNQCVLVDGKYWQGPPSLVIEVLSPSTEGLDWREKFDLYEQVGAPEYWLVSDPLCLHVFRLQGGKYAQQGTYDKGEIFKSSILGDHEVDVSKLLDA
jgi:Uma2 family endonuclease